MSAADTRTGSTPAIASIVLSYVNQQLRGKVFTVEQFVAKKELNSAERSAALKALSRLAIDKTLVRVANGTYYRPKESRFGRLPLEMQELVKVVAKTKKATVIPAGATAVNALGLDTQLPMVRSYFISERIRSDFKVKNVKFEYKESLHYFSEHFKVKDKEKRQAGLLFWSAISYMDERGVELYKNKLAVKFYSLLDLNTQEQFFNALSPSMKWVRDSLDQG
jgi:hypothetical protein